MTDVMMHEDKLEVSEALADLPILRATTRKFDLGRWTEILLHHPVGRVPQQVFIQGTSLSAAGNPDNYAVVVHRQTEEHISFGVWRVDSANDPKTKVAFNILMIF